MKHIHLQNLLNLHELFTSGICVHTFCLCFVAQINRLLGNNVWQSEKPLSLKRHENEEKIENDIVLRNDHRIKTTQPISMIFVFFFSEDNILSDEIKKCYIFEYQSNKNRGFHFFGTPGINASVMLCYVMLQSLW